MALAGVENTPTSFAWAPRRFHHTPIDRLDDVEVTNLVNIDRFIQDRQEERHKVALQYGEDKLRKASLHLVPFKYYQHLDSFSKTTPDILAKHRYVDHYINPGGWD